MSGIATSIRVGALLPLPSAGAAASDTAALVAAVAAAAAAAATTATKVGGPWGYGHNWQLCGTHLVSRRMHASATRVLLETQ